VGQQGNKLSRFQGVFGVPGVTTLFSEIFSGRFIFAMIAGLIITVYQF
jgi:hypothetical protein